MGTRRLEVVISGDSKSLSRAFGQTSRDLDQLDGRAKRTGAAFAGFGASLLKGGAVAAVTAFAGATAIGTRELLAQEKASARTANVLETTGGVANITAQGVEDLASALQSQTGTADDAIQSSANLLLTFTRVRNEAGKNNDVFNQGVAAANDMAVALGTDLNSATLLVGKALNDPIRGMTALRRSGVQLSEQQEEQVKAFVESGDVLSAQKVILGELETQFKGAASSEGEATEALQQFQRGFEDASEGLAAKLLPVVLSTVETFRRYWPEIQRVSERAFRGAQRAAQSAMDWFDTNIVPVIQGVVTAAQTWWAIFGDDVKRIFNLIRTVVGSQMRIIGAVIEGVLAVIRGDWGKAWASLKTAVSAAKTAVVAILRGMPAIVLGIALSIGKAILTGIVRGVTGLAARLSSKVTGAIRSLGGAVATAAAELGVKFANAVVSGAGNLGRRLLGLIPGVSSGSPNDGGRQEPGSGEETLANRQTLDAITRGGVAVGGNRAAARPGSQLDIDRTRSANSRSEGEARRTSEESYIRTRLANIAGLQSKLDTAYRRIEDAIKGEKASRSKIKVPRAAGPKRRKALQSRADITQRIRDLQDDLETIWQEYADLGVEAADLGGELSVLQRSGNEDAPTAADFADAQAALAALTADPADDIAAAINQQTVAGHALNAAIAGGDPRQIESAARAFAQARDNLARLQLEATQANTAAVEANTEATKQSFGGSVAFGFRGQMEVLRSLAMPSSDRLTGAEVGI